MNRRERAAMAKKLSVKYCGSLNHPLAKPFIKYSRTKKWQFFMTSLLREEK